MWREQAIIEWSWRVTSTDINVWTIEHDDQRTRRVIAARDLPQCETFHTWHSGFMIATVPTTYDLHSIDSNTANWVDQMWYTMWDELAPDSILTSLPTLL